MKKRACLKKAESSISVSSNCKQSQPNNQTITNFTSQVSSMNTFIKTEVNNQTVNDFTSHINSKDYVDSEANKLINNAASEVSSKKTPIKQIKCHLCKFVCD